MRSRPSRHGCGHAPRARLLRRFTDVAEPRPCTALRRAADSPRLRSGVRAPEDALPVRSTQKGKRGEAHGRHVCEGEGGVRVSRGWAREASIGPSWTCACGVFCARACSSRDAPQSVVRPASPVGEAAGKVSASTYRRTGGMDSHAGANGHRANRSVASEQYA
eukprot:1135431-Pleurochrysis_carterae.AAC.4